jgi:dsRNA-specific ribonuclease
VLAPLPLSRSEAARNRESRCACCPACHHAHKPVIPAANRLTSIKNKTSKQNFHTLLIWLALWAQGRGLPLPLYELVGREGPDHAPIFEIKVQVQGFPHWISKGISRRKAEKDAAAMLLAHLKEMDGE